MLLMSFRLNKRFICGVCGMIAILAVVVLAVGRYAKENRDIQASVASSGAVTKNYTVQTSEERLEFITQFGWEVEAEPCEIEEVLIPKEFDAVYQTYNEIQKAQGLDLKRFAGKKAKRFAYKVLNYPGYTGEVRLNLLAAQNKVIGGDVCALELDGFMHGFRYEEKTADAVK